MISIATLTGGAAAAYYLHERGCEHDLSRQVGYYVNGHEAPGRWLGRGAAALGLTGPLAEQGGRVLAELLEGQFAGTRLVAPVWRRDETGARVDVRRAGFDVTFSAPKSVSVVLALAQPDVAAQVLAAHRVAVTDAITLLEGLAARAARGHQGDGKRAPRIRTSGLVAAGFDHTTSRALDPQLHTHVVIANLAQGVDGRWSALDSRTLHREATTASYLYQHRLRAELTARLGVGWGPVERGIAELDGVPVSVRREFSTRRRQIEAALTRQPQPEPGGRVRGRARQLAARLACLATRPRKTHQPAEELGRGWVQRAETVGFGPTALAALLAQHREAPAADLTAVAHALLSTDALTREQATFSRGAVLRELLARLPAGAQVTTQDLLTTAAEVVTDEQVVPVLTSDGRAYTTEAMLGVEADTLALATRTQESLAALDRSRVAATIGRDGTRQGLRPDQQRLAWALLTSGRPVEVVTGPAGCGKTASLNLCRQAWQAAGIPVVGTAVAALTAQGLERASGAPSVSLARLLHHPDQHLPHNGVLLVDEAGMVGTRTLHQLLTTAAARRCKVVLVGDPAQLPELEAGGMFARLATHPTALHLDEHRRQQHTWERAALDALRTGDPSRALDAYRLHDRLHTHPDRDTLHTHAVQAYLAARAAQPDPWQTVLLASTREEVAELNTAVRTQLLGTGALSPQQVRVDTDDGPVSYRVGEQVLVTRNDHRRGLLNGTTGTVTTLDPDGLTLTLTGDRRQVQLDQEASCRRAEKRAGHPAFHAGLKP